MPTWIWPAGDSRQLAERLNRLLRDSSSRAWFVSPFVTRQGLEALSEAASRDIDVRLITRLNDEDVLAGVLDLEAIADLLEAGGQVRFHNKSLHAKLWVFDDLSLLGSANLTRQALSTNLELMAEVPIDPANQLPIRVFRNLWRSLKSHTCTASELRQMQARLKTHWARRRFEQFRDPTGLNDYGGTAEASAPSSGVSIHRPTPQGWLKINGRSDEQIDPGYDFRLQPMFEGGGQTVKSKGPGKGHPHVRPGDLVVLGRLGRRNGKNDLCIYGRGVVDVEHRPKIDEAPKWARKYVSRDWWENHMQRWPYIFWLRDVQLVNGLAASAPWVSNINHPKVILRPVSWSQQSHIRVNEEQLGALMAALDQAFLARTPIEIQASESIWWNKGIQDPQHHITRSRLEAAAS